MKSKASKKNCGQRNHATLFDHVNQIKLTKNEDYYKNLSDSDKKTFNHFLILRALSMNEDIIEEISELYKYVNLIPSEQFYKLLITIVPRDQYFHKWIKSRTFKNSDNLLSIISSEFKVPKYQANEYINMLLKTESGQNELIDICKSNGYTNEEIEKIFSETPQMEYLNQS